MDAWDGLRQVRLSSLTCTSRCGLRIRRLARPDRHLYTSWRWLPDRRLRAQAANRNTTQRVKTRGFMIILKTDSGALRSHCFAIAIAIVCEKKKNQETNSDQRNAHDFRAALHALSLVGQVMCVPSYSGVLFGSSAPGARTSFAG